MSSLDERMDRLQKLLENSDFDEVQKEEVLKTFEISMQNLDQTYPKRRYGKTTAIELFIAAIQRVNSGKNTIQKN